MSRDGNEMSQNENGTNQDEQWDESRW